MRPTRHNCSLAVEFALVRENILLQNERITQLYVIQSQSDPYLWFGVLFVDTGLYTGAIIRFNMIIDETYPDCPCPKIIFDPVPCHPLVDSNTGKLDTRNAFPDWNSNTHKLHQLLLFVKRVICQAETYIQKIQELISQQKANNNNNAQGFTSDFVALFNNFENTLNCITTYEDDPDEFQKRVHEFRLKCSQQLFDKPLLLSGDDENAIIFTPWDEKLHEPVRKSVLAGRFGPTSLFASYHKETDSVSFVPGSEPT